MKKLAMIVALIMLAPSAYALETHDITYSIEDDSIKAQHLLHLENRSTLELQLPADAYYFTVLVDDKTVDYSLEKSNNYKILDIPIDERSDLIEISYQTSEFLDKGQVSYFSAYVIPIKTDVLSIRLSLPSKALLARPIDSMNPPIIPEPDSIDTDGRQIVITWKQHDPKQTFSIFSVYEEKGQFPWKLSLGALIIIISIAAYIYMRNTDVFRSNAYSHLLEPEQEIMKALLKSKNYTMWQKELQIAAGFTKSRLSRTVRNMQERGIIEKIPYGSTNKIKLINKEEKK